MTTAQNALDQAVERCAQEPIQVPGSIQPQGFLLVLDEHDLRILQASENAERWLGLPARELIGCAFPDLISEGFDLRAHLQYLPDDEVFPFHIGDVQLRQGPGGERMRVLVHRHDQVLISEFEPIRSSPGPTGHGDYYPLVRAFVSSVHQAGSIEELLQQSVVQLKRITGFGRVKAYRFDAEGNGQVLAEVADPGYPSYLGLCFPASDIPRQARELYRVNRIRVIEDANYQASVLVPSNNPRTGKPLDMSFAALRSVSPVHLQYMRNMGTLASMSLSIVVDGQLWGLVSCHHEQPHRVDLPTRTACELLGSVLSLQIESREAHTSTRTLLDMRQRIVRMLASMADHDNVSQGLRALPDVLLDFAGASGAAIISAERCDLIGITPPEAQVNALVHWLGGRGEVFHTDNIRRDIDELPELAEHAGGLLAVSISQIHSNYLVWFRPEQIRTVTWAGRPEKHISAQGSLDPRNSFERWQEQLSGFCQAWDPLVIEGAQELRGAVFGIVLRKAEELAQLAGELKRSNKELEAFSYSVSHDLRAPLRHIAGYTELLGEIEGAGLSERGRRFLQHIEEAAHFAGTLVDNLLNFSQMGRSALRLSDVDLNTLVEAIRSEMAPDYAGREIVWEVEQLPRVIGDPAFINMALHNLIANAIKYTRGRQPARISIGARQLENETEIFIRDNGVGFDMAYAGKLFGVFQRLHRMEDFEGTGIGLASVRRIIERHDGRVWADGQIDQGASFHFTLPRNSINT